MTLHNVLLYKHTGRCSLKHHNTTVNYINYTMKTVLFQRHKNNIRRLLASIRMASINEFNDSDVLLYE